VKFNAKVKKQKVEIIVEGNAKEKKKELRRKKGEAYKYKKEIKRTTRHHILHHYQPPHFLIYLPSIFS